MSGVSSLYQRPQDQRKDKIIYQLCQDQQESADDKEFVPPFLLDGAVDNKQKEDSASRLQDEHRESVRKRNEEVKTVVPVKNVHATG